MDTHQLSISLVSFSGGFSTQLYFLVPTQNPNYDSYCGNLKYATGRYFGQCLIRSGMASYSLPFHSHTVSLPNTPDEGKVTRLRDS